jgi:transcriptional regulator with XRE-family HTH domain
VPLDPLPSWAPARHQEIGDRIRAERRARSLSQLQLAERIGRDHKTVHRWETAITAPDLIDLLLIADALDLQLSDLVR